MSLERSKVSILPSIPPPIFLSASKNTDTLWSKDPQARLSAFARHDQDQAGDAPPHGITTAPSGANARMPPSDDPAGGYLSDTSEASARSSSSSAYGSSSQPIPQPTSPPAQEELPSSSIVAPRPAGPAPCPFLQSTLASLAPAPAYPAIEPYPARPQGEAHAHAQEEGRGRGKGLTTTNGAYLETLLTHRALLGAFPPGHAGCGDALREIAREVEVRAWRAWDGEWRPDWDGDAEAVAAFRQEAYLVDTWVAESRARCR